MSLDKAIVSMSARKLFSADFVIIMKMYFFSFVVFFENVYYLINGIYLMVLWLQYWYCFAEYHTCLVLSIIFSKKNPKKPKKNPANDILATLDYLFTCV